MLNFDEKSIFCPPELDEVPKPLFFGDIRQGAHSLPERVDRTARELRETLERLQTFETWMKGKYEELTRNMTNDNVTFKKLMQNGWADFVATVRSEVNLFESNIQATLKLFEESTNADIEEQTTRIQAAELFMRENIAESLTTLLHEMDASGELAGVIEADVLISVKSRGAKGDGGTDDTAAIQAALNSLPEGGTVYFPNGIYMVSDDLIVPAKVTVKGDTSSIVRRMPNALTTYNVFKVVEAGNVTFDSLIIEGDREKHEGTAGEWGMGISFNAATDCVVRNCVISDCWGDGIYIGSHGTVGSKNITVDGVRVDYARRNGISVINVDGLLVTDCDIRNTSGTAPQYGICFECNETNESVKNAHVSDCIFSDNKYGIGFSGGSNVYEVTVDGCTFNGTNGVYICATRVENLGGFILVRNSVFKSALGFVFDAKTPTGIPVFIDNCQFFCTNIPVRIGYAGMNVEATIGGISINNCTFAKWAESQYPIMIRSGDHASATYSDIYINSRILPNAHSFVFISSPNTGNVEITPQSVGVKNLTADTTMTGTAMFTRANVNTASGAKTVTLTESVPYGVEMEFRITGSNAYGMTFRCEDGAFTQIDDNTTEISFTGLYTTVKIRHEAANRWSFVKSITEV